MSCNDPSNDSLYVDENGGGSLKCVKADIIPLSCRLHTGGNGAVVGAWGNAGRLGTATVEGRDGECSDVGDPHVVGG